MITIVDIDEKHISGFHLAFDSVARERQFLARTEAPALESLLSSVVEGISKRVPCVVAVDKDTVVGWCQILPHTRPTEIHCGALGMGVLASYRNRGVGAELLRQALLRQSPADCNVSNLKYLLEMMLQFDCMSARASIERGKGRLPSKSTEPISTLL